MSVSQQKLLQILEKSPASSETKEFFRANLPAMTEEQRVVLAKKILGYFEKRESIKKKHNDRKLKIVEWFEETSQKFFADMKKKIHQAAEYEEKVENKQKMKDLDAQLKNL